MKIVPFLSVFENFTQLFCYQQTKGVDINVLKSDGTLVSLIDSFLKDIGQHSNSKGEPFTTWDLRAYLNPTEADFFWEVADDKGQFKYCYNALFDNIIKETETIRRPERVGAFNYMDEVYSINFDSNVVHKRVTGEQRSIRKSQPFWCYFGGNDTGYIRHEVSDSEKIENIYRFGGKSVKMGGTVYVLNFDPSKALQVDIHTGEEIQIIRVPSIVACPCDWSVEFQMNGPYRYVTHIIQWLDSFVQNTFKTLKVTFPCPIEDKHYSYVFHQIVNISRQYCVGFNCLQSPNKEIHLEMFGASGYVNQVLKDIKLLTDQEFLSLNHSTDLPVEWEPQSQESEIKPVRVDSTEWVGISKLMKKTLPSLVMVKVERVQNRPLWDKYYLEKKQISKTNGEVNEKLLFHGSRSAVPRNIVLSSKGIDFRCSSRKRPMMWGTGAYFAANASYSDNYAHSVDSSLNKEVILACVLTGNSYSYGKKTDSSLTKPPSMPQLGASAPAECKLYDTVNGCTNGSTVYVVYDHDKSYPAYIITYRTYI